MKKTVMIVLIGSLGFLQCVKQVAGGGDDVTTGTAIGYLYCQDGSPATKAGITVISSDNLPGTSLSDEYYSTTDSRGKYVLAHLAPGRYNVFCKQNSLASLLEEVLIQNARAGDTLPNDTLKESGMITGTVRLAGGEDCRTILIMVIGANLITWPDDTSGVFAFGDLAEGNYRIRFLSTLPYPVLDTTFSVISGLTADVGTITLKGKN